MSLVFLKKKLTSQRQTAPLQIKNLTHYTEEIPYLYIKQRQTMLPLLLYYLAKVKYQWLKYDHNITYGNKSKQFANYLLILNMCLFLSVRLSLWLSTFFKWFYFWRLKYHIILKIFILKEPQTNKMYIYL